MSKLFFHRQSQRKLVGLFGLQIGICNTTEQYRLLDTCVFITLHIRSLFGMLSDSKVKRSLLRYLARIS